MFSICLDQNLFKSYSTRKYRKIIVMQAVIWKKARGGLLSRLVDGRKRRGKAGRNEKNDQQAEEVIEVIGEDDYNDAPLQKDLEECAKALGLAENSITIRRVYKQRQMIFDQLGQLKDAIQTNCLFLENGTERQRQNLFRLHQIDEQRNRLKKFSRYGQSRRWHVFAEGLEVATDELHPHIGRFVRTNRSHRVGEKVVVAEPYAFSYANNIEFAYCLTCGITSKAIFPCERCPNAFFCSILCQLKNKTHRFECGTDFHTNGAIGLDAKLVIYMVLQGIVAFNNDIDKMRQRTLEIVATLDQNRVPRGSRRARHRYECVVRLAADTPDDWQTITEAYYNTILSLPEVNSLFNKYNNKLFLQNLIAHFTKVSIVNGFQLNDNVTGRRGNVGTAIYDAASFFNHSCTPNVGVIIQGLYFYIRFQYFSAFITY